MKRLFCSSASASESGSCSDGSGDAVSDGSSVPCLLKSYLF